MLMLAAMPLLLRADYAGAAAIFAAAFARPLLPHDVKRRLRR